MNKLRSIISSVLFTITIFSFIAVLCVPTTLVASTPVKTENKYVYLTVAKGGLFIGMTKREAFDVEGVPYRVKRLSGEDKKEMWICRCNNDDGFDEDCLYLYFDDDELEEIERP